MCSSPSGFVAVDLEPLAARGVRVPRGLLDEPGRDAAALDGHLRVEEERLVAAVPRHVDEADQLVVQTRRHPAEAVRTDLVPPARDCAAAVGQLLSTTTID
jgi:hypothetical protein